MTPSGMNVMLATRWLDSLTPFAIVEPGTRQPRPVTVSSESFFAN